MYAECSDPDMPADIKAAATGDDSVLLVWRRPLHSNGILTKYTILMNDMSDREVTAVLDNFYVVVYCQCNNVKIHRFVWRTALFTCSVSLFTCSVSSCRFAFQLRQLSSCQFYLR